ncbi:uncharacterized protein [Primulina eburnea]|uniref:uncharacterized protein n=1 Tax=Primulina eburnea TaxID=1245227 RepID=UPI003C6C1A18
MRQRRWIEYSEDYDGSILYQSGKANVVADALSRKISIACLEMKEERKWVHIHSRGHLAGLRIEPEFHTRIKQNKDLDQEFSKLRTDTNFVTNSQGILCYHDRICVSSSMKKEIMEKSHQSRISIHPGGSKMYQEIKKTLLGERNETRYCKFHFTMPILPNDKG